MRRVLALLATILALTIAVGHGASAGGVGDWPSWTKDLRGSRHNAAEHRITAGTAGALRLAWAFGQPKSLFALRSQPAVVDGRLYFGGSDGKFYALDARRGTTIWTFDLSSVAPGTGAVVRDGAAVAGGKVYFGDHRGYLYALDQHTGALAWATRLDTHPAALITSSPSVFAGRVYVGTSSNDNTGGTDYACCTFRGHLDALDSQTGALVWRHYTVPEPQPVGTWPSGATRYEPSGAGVWSSPVVDPATHTVYAGTGQNYSGSSGESDSMLALDAFTGQVRWTHQLTHPDTWRTLCSVPTAPPGYCPGLNDGTALDFDLGAAANIFTIDGRTVVGVGQKSGVYHVLDAHTGEIVWQRQLSVPSANAAQAGILWGSGYDGRRLYVTTYQARPSTLFALDPATGDVLWSTPAPADGCSWGGAAAQPLCLLANTPAVTTTPGVVWEGGSDGKMRAYAAADGHVLWEFDTVRDFAGVNGVTGRGSGIAGNGGAVVAGGMLYVLSGFRPVYPSDNGPVLLAFRL